MHVYTVEGLGFGDDEYAWELCCVYATEQAAQAKVQEITADDCIARYTKMEVLS